jgi:hypothetical protein
MVTSIGALQPRAGKDRIDHARRIAVILENKPFGLTIPEIITEYYNGTIPSTQARLEYEVEEFKRSYKYCNDRFNAHELGWVWIRTRKRHPNDWVYMAVAKMCSDNVVRIIDAAISYESYNRYERDWETRTQTLTRMQVLDIKARESAALMSGDVETAKKYESELDHLKIVSPRLGLMYFGAGLMDENLEILENDPRARLINKQIKEVRGNLKRLQRSTAALAQNVEGILKLRGVI